MNDSMGDLGWLRAQLDRHAYRPDWRMRIEQSSQGVPVSTYVTEHLVVEFTVQNTYQPDRQIPVVSRRMIPPYLAEMRDEAEFTRWLQHALFDIEMHESREWLRRDGEIFDNPHAPQGAR